MSEWGVTPEYVNENWTEEMLGRMFQTRASINSETTDGNRKVSNSEMFDKPGKNGAGLGVAIRRVKAKKRS